MEYILRDYQEEASNAGVEYFLERRKRTKSNNGVIVAPTGSGKCYRRGTEILMYDGKSKKVENIKVGDSVMGLDSCPKAVISLARGREKMYKIQPKKFDEFVCNESHILSLVCNSRKTRYGHNSVINISVNDYIKLPKSVKHTLKLYKSDGIEFEYKYTNLDPYFVGLWLSEGEKTKGHHTHLTIGGDDEELLTYLNYIGSPKIKKYKDRNCYSVKFTKEKGYYTRVNRNPINQEFSRFCDYDTKEVKIIDDYLYNSSEKRKRLLAGLLDGDGYLDRRNWTFEIISKFKSLSDDILFLARSLGFHASVQNKYVNDVLYYRIYISGDLHLLPSLVLRKTSIQNPKKTMNHLRSGFDIEKLDVEDYYGFNIEGNDKRHLLSNFLVVHNSLIIADIAHKLDDHVLIFQPRKELLIQNYEKYVSYGNPASIYSASAGRKEIGKVTFATIGSVVNEPEKFEHFNYCIIDECHLVPPRDSSMYQKFLSQIGAKILGLTATPIRLKQYNFPTRHSKLNMLDRMRPRVFGEYIHITQIQELVKREYFAKTEYHQVSFDRSQLQINSTGGDFTEKSMTIALEQQGTNDKVVEAIGKLLEHGRKHIAVFVPSVAEAQYIAYKGGGAAVHAKTNKKRRDTMLKQFKSGDIPFVVNVGILGIGFDFPALDTILIARPTMSLAMFYQWLGRGVRPHPDKEKCLIIDFVGNIDKFGEVEGLEIRQGEHGWGIYSDGVLLTNRDVSIDGDMYREKKKDKKPLKLQTMDFGKHSGEKMEDVPRDYLHWVWKNVESKSWTKNVLNYIKDNEMFDRKERLVEKKVES